MKYNRLRTDDKAYRPRGRTKTRRYSVRDRAAHAALPPLSPHIVKNTIKAVAVLTSVVMLSTIVLCVLSGLRGGSADIGDSPAADIPEYTNGTELGSTEPLDMSIYDRSYELTPDTLSQTNPYNNKVYTHPASHGLSELTYGVDISSLQGGINWLLVRSSGIRFAMIRAGSRGYAGGQLYEDKAFDVNMRSANAVGMKVGVYVYSQAISSEEILEEANMVLRRIQKYKIDMPVVLDYEFADVGDGLGGRLFEAKLSAEEATDMCLLFCRTVRAAGYEPMVYANTYVLSNHLELERLCAESAIWVSYPSDELKYTGPHSMWQYSWTGRVDGIPGDVDMDFYYTEH